MSRAAAPVAATADRPARGLHAVAPDHATAELQAERYADAVTSRTTSGDVAWSFAQLPVHPAPRPDAPQLDVRLDEPGDLLAPALRDSLGAGLDLAGTRVHTGPEAAQTAHHTAAVGAAHRLPLRCSPRGRAAKLAARAAPAALGQSPRVRSTKRAARADPETALLGAADIAPPGQCLPLGQRQ